MVFGTSALRLLLCMSAVHSSSARKRWLTCKVVDAGVLTLTLTRGVDGIPVTLKLILTAGVLACLVNRRGVDLCWLEVHSGGEVVDPSLTAELQTAPRVILVGDMLLGRHSHHVVCHR